MSTWSASRITARRAHSADREFSSSAIGPLQLALGTGIQRVSDGRMQQTFGASKSHGQGLSTGLAGPAACAGEGQVDHGAGPVEGVTRLRCSKRPDKEQQEKRMARLQGSNPGLILEPNARYMAKGAFYSPPLEACVCRTPGMSTEISLSTRCAKI